MSYAPLTPRQDRILAQMREIERSEWAPDVGDLLRSRIEAGAGGARVSLTKWKIGGLLSCQRRHQSDMDSTFEWSPTKARGTVAHKAVELFLNWPDEKRPPPAELTRMAIDQTVREEQNLGGWLRDAPPEIVAELSSGVTAATATFVEVFPPLPARWNAQTEVTYHARVGGVDLPGRPDLTIGLPAGNVSGKLILDLKTGGKHQQAHMDDGHHYALIDTLRTGVPPFAVGVVYLGAGDVAIEPVTQGSLDAAADRVVAAVRAHETFDPMSTAPGPLCRWCDVQPVCAAGGGIEPEPVGSKAVEIADRARRSAEAAAVKARSVGPVTAAQLEQLATLGGKQGDLDTQAGWVLSYTGERTGHFSQMTAGEAAALIEEWAVS
mgnify:CR=1 FL=1